MQSYYSSILQRPVSEQKNQLLNMLPGNDVEEIDINKEERMPLNQDGRDIESLDNDVEAIDFHMSLQNKEINLSMFNLSSFFHPTHAMESDHWVNEFKDMNISNITEEYDDIEGQISAEEEKIQDLQEQDKPLVTIEDGV